MNRKIYYILMALTMTITSCQTNNDALNFCYNENKIELTEAEISSIMFDDEVKLTKDEAVEHFQSLCRRQPYNSTKRPCNQNRRN